MMIRRVGTVVPAEGAILERVLDATYLATAILTARESVPSYKRSSRVNPSSVRRSALGSLTASHRRR
jgi:hypothetical protein